MKRPRILDPASDVARIIAQVDADLGNVRTHLLDANPEARRFWQQRIDTLLDERLLAMQLREVAAP